MNDNKINLLKEYMDVFYQHPWCLNPNEPDQDLFSAHLWEFLYEH